MLLWSMLPIPPVGSWSGSRAALPSSCGSYRGRGRRVRSVRRIRTVGVGRGCHKARCPHSDCVLRYPWVVRRHVQQPLLGQSRSRRPSDDQKGFCRRIEGERCEQRLPLVGIQGALPQQRGERVHGFRMVGGDVRRVHARRQQDGVGCALRRRKQHGTCSDEKRPSVPHVGMRMHIAQRGACRRLIAPRNGFISETTNGTSPVSPRCARDQAMAQAVGGLSPADALTGRKADAAVFPLRREEGGGQSAVRNVCRAWGMSARASPRSLSPGSAGRRPCWIDRSVATSSLPRERGAAPCVVKNGVSVSDALSQRVRAIRACRTAATASGNGLSKALTRASMRAERERICDVQRAPDRGHAACGLRATWPAGHAGCGRCMRNERVERATRRIEHVGRRMGA